MLGLGLGLARVRPASAGICSGASPALMHFGFAANRYYTRQAGQSGVTSHPFADLMTFTGPDGRTYTNSAGDTVTAGLNEPRLGDYINTGGGLFNGGLRINDDDGEALPVNPVALADTFGGVMPDAITIAIKGHITYADEGSVGQFQLFNWEADSDNSLRSLLDTDGSDTGSLRLRQEALGATTGLSSSNSIYAPGTHVRISHAYRFGSGASSLNAAHEGILLTAVSPAALPDLISALFEIARSGNIVIEEMTIYGANLGDTGLVAATTDGSGFNPLCPFD